MILIRSGLVNAVIVFFSFTLLINYEVAFADYDSREDFLNAGRWRIAFGMQWNQHVPALHYELLNDSSKPTLDINQGDKSEIVEPFSYVDIERRLSEYSGIDLTYTKDRTSSVLLGRKNVRFLFFLLRPTVMAPVDIDVETMRLRYFHAIVRAGNFEFGGSGGLQALYCTAHASIPVIGYSEENYFIVLPCVGTYATYQQNKCIRYSVHADYLPIELKKISGRIAEVDCSVEYNINSNLFVGAGCRYSVKSLDLKNKKYLMNASYSIVGVLAFIGISL